MIPGERFLEGKMGMIVDYKVYQTRGILVHFIVFALYELSYIQ